MTVVRVVRGPAYAVRKYLRDWRKANRKCTHALRITSYTSYTASGKRTHCRADNVRPRGPRLWHSTHTFGKYTCDWRKESRKCAHAVPISSYTADNVRPRDTRLRDFAYAVRIIPFDWREASRKCTLAVPITSYIAHTARGERIPCRAVNVRPRGTVHGIGTLPMSYE